MAAVPTGGIGEALPSRGIDKEALLVAGGEDSLLTHGAGIAVQADKQAVGCDATLALVLLHIGAGPAQTGLDGQVVLFGHQQTGIVAQLAQPCLYALGKLAVEGPLHQLTSVGPHGRTLARGVDAMAGIENDEMFGAEIYSRHFKMKNEKMKNEK